MLLPNGKTSSIYVIYHFPYRIVNSEVFTQIRPSQVLAPDLPSMISADSGNEISNKNSLIAEYSTYYWVWKNTIPTDYIGFFQYRRYIPFLPSSQNSSNDEILLQSNGWTKEHLSTITDNFDIILPGDFYLWRSIKDHYPLFHDKFYLDKSIEIISNKYPYIAPYYIDALNQWSGHFCNMFYMKWEYFDEYMNFIMDVFSELEKHIKPDYQEKCLAFVAERIFNGFTCYLKNSKNPRLTQFPILFL